MNIPGKTDERALEGSGAANGSTDWARENFSAPPPYVKMAALFRAKVRLQGLSGQLITLKIVVSQPSEQLEINAKYQYVLYLAQFCTYSGVK